MSVSRPPAEQCSTEVECPQAPALSAETYAISVDSDRFLIYAPLRRSAFLGNADVVRLLQRLEAKAQWPLDESDRLMLDVLRALGMVDGASEAAPALRLSGPPEPVGITLLLTTTCNLRCRYCYASAGDRPAKSMPLEIAQRGIDFLIANVLKRKQQAFQISFHGGGEPTQNWRVMTGAVEYARQKAEPLGLQFGIGMATNGVLSDVQIDWLIANKAGLTVSFDGLPEVQDLNRPTRSGKGSSERVIHTMKRFDEAGHTYGVRSTITGDRMWDLPRAVEFVFSNFRTNYLHFEPVYTLGRGQGAAPAESDEFIAAFRAGMDMARRFGREISFSAVRLGTLTNHFCGTTQDSFCLTPSGNVTACYEACSEDDPFADRFFYGKPAEDGGYEFDMQKVEWLRAQSVDNRAHCRGCFAKWNCAGDCHYKCMVESGGAEPAGAGRCHIIRELTKDLILDKIARSPEGFWTEGNWATGCKQETRQSEPQA